MKTTITTEEDLFTPAAGEGRIAENWYAARQYVLASLAEWEKASPSHHYVIKGQSDMLLSVARQIALVSHYIGATTVIDFTDVSDACGLIERLGRPEFLNNLARYCRISIIRKNGSEEAADGMRLNYLDIELRIFEGCSCNACDGCTVIDDSDIDRYLQNTCVRHSIDVRKAKWVNMVYSVGAVLDNLPPDDPNTEGRYDYALDVFCYRSNRRKREEEWNRIDPKDVKRKLSNVFCADCFESDIRSASTEKSSLASLAECEHARWNVEKLIMGYRPLTFEEKHQDELLFGKEQVKYRKALQNRTEDPAHIDLCSYTELKRVNPEDMKYDCFLMLAMPQIMKSCSR